jgi:FG-GAP-like repeat
MNPVVRKTYLNAAAYTDTTFVPAYSATPQASVFVPNNPYSVKLVDLNADGELDLISTNYGNNTISIAMGVGNGVFNTPVSHMTGSGPIGVDVGDFNLGNLLCLVCCWFLVIMLIRLFILVLDSVPDVVVTNIGEHTVSCLFGDGAGGVTSQVKYGTGTSPFGITIADLNTNGAGYDDIIVSNFEENTLSILWSLGDGTFVGPPLFIGFDWLIVETFVPAGTLFTGVNTRRLVAAKLTNSNAYDLICANQLDNNVGVFIGTGQGAFAPQATHTVGNGPIGLGMNVFLMLDY